MSGPELRFFLLFAVLLALSAFFSACETAVSSINKIRMKNAAENGSRRARIALENAENYDQTLSAVLIGNNVVNLTLSSIAAVAATARFGSSGAAISTILVTVFVLIFGEILPKSYAKDSAEKFACATAVPLKFIRLLLSPVVWLFVQIKSLLTGRRGSELNVQPSVTADELQTIVDTVGREGVLGKQETGIIKSAIDLDETTVQDILVPRVDICAVELTSSPDQLLHLFAKCRFSRIPVYQGSIDNIVGILYAKDLLRCLVGNEGIDLKKLIRPVKYVHRSMHIGRLLAEFRREKQHMAVVTDDFGGVLGIITMEDILEELVGEIWDETDKTSVPVRKIGKLIWEADGEMNPVDFFETIGYTRLGFDADFPTMAGWALDRFKHIPAVGESFVCEPFTVTVKEMDDQRILRLRIEKNAGSATGERNA